MDVVTFNPDGKKIGVILLDDLQMSRAKISDLRVVIYQIDDSTPELKDLRIKLEKYLKFDEEELEKKFFSEAFGYSRIEE